MFRLNAGVAADVFILRGVDQRHEGVNEAGSHQRRFIAPPSEPLRLNSAWIIRAEFPATVPPRFFLYVPPLCGHVTFGLTPSHSPKGETFIYKNTYTSSSKIYWSHFVSGLRALEN